MERDPSLQHGMGSGVPRPLKPCSGCGGQKPINAGARKRYCSEECKRKRYPGPKPKKTIRQKKQVNLLALARRRSKKYNLQFNITIEDVTIPETCPVLGIDLILDQSRGFSDNSPTVDRIDNTRGYEKGNVLVISWRANRIKADSNLEELRLLYQFYSKKSEAPWHIN